MRTFTLRRRLPPSSAAFFVLAVACAVAAFLLVRGGAPAATMVKVVVAAHDVAAGAPLLTGDLETAAVPEAYLPPGAIRTAADAAGRYTTGPLAAGEVLTELRLAPSKVGAWSLAPGRLAVRLAIASVPSGLESGDRVDVIAAVGGGRAWAAVAAENLRVLAVVTSGASATVAGAAGSSWIEVDVDPATAVALARAASYAELTVGVRGPPAMGG